MGDESRREQAPSERPAPDTRDLEHTFEEVEKRIFRELCHVAQVEIPEDGRTVVQLFKEAVSGDSEQGIRLIEIAEKANKLARVELLKRGRRAASTEWLKLTQAEEELTALKGTRVSSAPMTPKGAEVARSIFQGPPQADRESGPAGVTVSPSFGPQAGVTAARSPFGAPATAEVTAAPIKHTPERQLPSVKPLSREKAGANEFKLTIVGPSELE